ncbi:hypothetical protein IKP85_04640 [bacterium]|nr:hypothetical protein [bacterium]
MKVTPIAYCNYNTAGKKLNDNPSTPVFKGQNFAKILKENYKDTQSKNTFDIFKDLMQKASEEVGFKITNKGVFNNLQAIKNIDDLVSLLKNWHLNITSSSVIAKDSRGPIIEYVVFNPHQTAHTNAIKELRFSSVGKDGCKQQTSFQTVKFDKEIAQSFVDSSYNTNFYDIS